MVLVDDLRRIRMIADYQFGEGAGRALFDDEVIERSRKTGKIRHIYTNEKLICTMRASDGLLVLSAEGGEAPRGKRVPCQQGCGE